MNIVRLKLFVITLILIFFGNTFQSNCYNPLNTDQTNCIFQSNTRHIISLAGKWDKSFDEEEWWACYLPYSEPGTQKVTYQRTIKIQKDLLHKYEWHLNFLGIDDKIDIYINNQFVGKHISAMTPFDVLIPKRMFHQETVTIKLIVSPAIDAERKVKEQYVYAKKVSTGVIREVFLIGTPLVWVNNVKYATSFNQDYSSSYIRTSVNMSSGDFENISNKQFSTDSSDKLSLNKLGFSVQTMIINTLNNDTIARSQIKQVEMEPVRNISIDFDMNIISPRLWSPGNPELYKLYTRITKGGKTIDDYSVNLGFVDIKVKEIKGVPKIYINGNPMEIKGVDYIEDYYSGNETLSPQRMERDIISLQKLGANTIRFKYNVPHPYMAYLCSKYGLLMLIELPVYDVPYGILNSDEIKVRMNNICRLILSAYDNQPSVLGWGISEGVLENPDYDSEFSKSLTKLCKQLSKKLIYKTVWFGAEKIHLTNYDFIGLKYNENYQSTNDIVSELKRLQSLAPKTPMFVSFGIPIQPNNHKGYSDPNSIEYQAYYIQNIFQIAKSVRLSGSVIWSFNDYELNNPLLIIDFDDQYLCTTGLLSRDRQQRLSFATLQALFNNENEPLLNAGSYSEVTPVSFIVIGILLSFILIVLMNRFKRFREYLTRSVMRPYNFYADIRDQRIMSISQTILLGSIICITTGIFLSSIFYFYRTSALAQHILVLLLPINRLQELLFRIIWMPEVSMIVFSILSLIVLFFVSLIIKISSLFIRGRIFINDALTISIWSCVPILILLPISIILIRLLVFSPGFIIPILLLAIAIKIWVIFRLLRATSVVFDVPNYRIYTIGFSIILIIAIIFISIYHFNFSIFEYGNYLFNFLKS